MLQKQMCSVALESDSPPKSSNCKMKIYSNDPTYASLRKMTLRKEKNFVTITVTKKICGGE